MSGSVPDDSPLIDFDRSYLVWTTIDSSFGYWRVVASATAISDDGKRRDRFLLTPMVMAGNVYGPGRLPLDPPYSFQFIASVDRHAIVRDYPGDARGKDSAGRNSELFAKIDIHAPPLQSQRLNPATISAENIARIWPMTARLRLEVADGAHWLLDFPIRHANAEPAGKSPKFQIETGPVLVPERLVEPSLATILNGFALAYVFFNRFDRVDLLLFGPAPAGLGQGRAYGIFGGLDKVAITIYGRASPQA